MHTLNEKQKATIQRLAPFTAEDVIAEAKMDPYGITTVLVPSIYVPMAKMRVNIDRDGGKFHPGYEGFRMYF
jgi:hypothetical protein